MDIINILLDMDMSSLHSNTQTFLKYFFNINIDFGSYYMKLLLLLSLHRQFQQFQQLKHQAMCKHPKMLAVPTKLLFHCKIF